MNLKDSWGPWPFYEEDEIAAVTKVLRSGKVNYWTGEEGRYFEREYASYLGRKHAIAVANGTVALELALLALDIGAGDEVIVPSRTYVASASCAVMRGAVPVVADVDLRTQLITVDTIKSAMTAKTKAIIVVHLAGWPCQMDEIMDFADKQGLLVIEDCAQAHGARYKGKPVGSWGHAAAFSFCQDKILTTGGEGGLLALDDEALWKKAWAYKDIGRSYDAIYHTEHGPGFRWLTKTFGTNWRLTEMQSTLGRLQLKKLDGWIEKRRANAQILNAGFAEIPGLKIHVPQPDSYHSYYKYYAFVETSSLKAEWTRNRIMDEISARAIPCSVGSCSEIYLEEAFASLGYGPKSRLPNARQLGDTSLMFQVHPTLDQSNMERSVEVVREVMTMAVK